MTKVRGDGRSVRPGGEDNAPRDKVVRHLHRLVGSVAAAGMLATCDPPPLVSDPLPPPIRCAEDPPSYYLPSHLSVDARWAAGDQVDVALAASTYGGGGTLAFQADPVVRRGGTLLEKERAETSLSFACGVEATGEPLEVEIPMTCDAQALLPLLSLDTTGARTEGTRVPSRLIVTP